jgi:YHS domain-containing protein
MAKDLICGMQVDEKSPAGTSEYEGKTYYFCSPGCKTAFDKDPEKYINPRDEHAGSHHHD